MTTPGTEGLIIDGQRVAASDGGTFDVYDPSSGGSARDRREGDGRRRRRARWSPRAPRSSRRRGAASRPPSAAGS